MPSHRQGNIPKHRAGRPHENASRPALLNAAGPAKRIAPGNDPGGYGSGPPRVMPAAFTPVPDHALPGHAVPDHPLPHRAPPHRALAPGAATAPMAAPVPLAAAAPAPRAPRWKRGLLVTPWFAAGAGFVIAAALSLNSPRTFLTYRPNAAPGTSTCADCQPESVPTARPGVQIKSVHPAQADGRAATAVTPAVRVRLGPEVDGLFSVTFLLPASEAGRSWKVQFTLPGRSVTGVVGARWQPDAAQDGGLAAALGQGQGQYVSPVDPGSVSFLVSAGGPPVRPAGCLLDGRACHFS
jgi:hypothetical protein